MILLPRLYGCRGDYQGPSLPLLRYPVVLLSPGQTADFYCSRLQNDYIHDYIYCLRLLSPFFLPFLLSSSRILKKSP